MTRLCFLCSDVEITRRAVASLRRAGLADSSLSLIAGAGIPLDRLPAAGIERTDALPGFARGFVAGGIIGAIAGLVALNFEEFAALGVSVIALFALFGAVVSGLAGLLAGAAVLSSRLRKFRHAIEREKRILLMVNVRRDRMNEIETLMKAESPQIEYAGPEPAPSLIPL